MRKVTLANIIVTKTQREKKENGKRKRWDKRTTMGGGLIRFGGVVVVRGVIL